MTSLGKNTGPYSYDANIVEHRNAKIATIINSDFDSLIEDIETVFEYEVGYVPPGFEHRPDLISNVFYGTPKNWWLLMLVNGISDPFEGFALDQRILIRKLR